MDHRDVKIAKALKAKLKRKRKETRLMKELLRAGEVAVQKKAKECAMLKRKKQRLIAVEADKEKVVHDFMLFLEAIDHHKNDDAKNSPKFDEKTMKNTIFTMMNGGGGHGGHDGGFAVDDDAKKEA